MPIYEYDCENCGVFESIQAFSDKPLKLCPNCKEAGKKSKVRRLISTSAFHLKGTGWYVTDFKNNDKNKKDSKIKPDSLKEAKDAPAESSTSKSPDTAKPEVSSTSKPETGGKTTGTVVT